MKFNKTGKSLLFVVSFLLIQFVIGIILKADYNSLGRIMLHELHTTETIDVLLLGDSHLRKGLNIDLLEKLSDKKFFSASSSNQEIDTSYALLQECYTYHPELKEVYITLDYFYTYIGDFKDRTQMNNIYNISDYLKNKKVKYNYLFNCSSPKYYINHFLQFNKDRISINPKNILLQIKSIVTGNYWKYDYPETDDEIYTGKGCCISYDMLEGPLALEADIISFENENISDDYINTIHKIINYCKERNLKYTFITIPMEPFCIYSINNYDSFASCLISKFNKSDFNYFDFNFAKKEYLNLKNQDYYDQEHQNYDGSIKTTKFFNTFINTDDDEKNSLFYKNLEEKSINNDYNFYGIYYDLSEQKDELVIYPVYNYYNNTNLEYNYYLKQEDNITELKSNSNRCRLPSKSTGELLVSINMNETKVFDFTFPFNTLWMDK